MTANPVAPRLRSTVAQFERMGDGGVLDSAERCELLDGDVVRVPIVGPQHAGTNDRIIALLLRHLSERAVVRSRNPVQLPPRSMPRPDVVLARHRQDFHGSAHPTAEGVHLVVEVSDSSLRIDRLVELPICAGRGVREVWIVDLAAELVHVHRDPVDDSHRTAATASRGERISPLDFPDVAFTVEELLG